MFSIHKPTAHSHSPRLLPLSAFPACLPYLDYFSIPSHFRLLWVLAWLKEKLGCQKSPVITPPSQPPSGEKYGLMQRCWNVPTLTSSKNQICFVNEFVKASMCFFFFSPSRLYFFTGYKHEAKQVASLSTPSLSQSVVRTWNCSEVEAFIWPSPQYIQQRGGQYLMGRTPASKQTV